jgi:hypothetical protein
VPLTSCVFGDRDWLAGSDRDPSGGPLYRPRLPGLFASLSSGAHYTFFGHRMSIYCGLLFFQSNRVYMIRINLKILECTPPALIIVSGGQKSTSEGERARGRGLLAGLLE